MIPASMLRPERKPSPPPTRAELTSALRNLVVANTAALPLLLSSELDDEEKNQLSSAILKGLTVLGQAMGCPNAIIEVQIDPETLKALDKAIAEVRVTEAYAVAHTALDQKIQQLAKAFRGYEARKEKGEEPEEGP